MLIMTPSRLRRSVEGIDTIGDESSVRKTRHRYLTRINYEREKHLGSRWPRAHPFSKRPSDAYVEGYSVEAKLVRLRVLCNYQPLTVHPLCRRASDVLVG